MRGTLKRNLDRVYRAKTAGRIDQALRDVDRLMEASPDNPVLLKVRAELIQMGSETAPPLAQAKQCLKQAAELESDSPRAWLELGFYCLNVEDDAKEAQKYFDKAISLGQEIITDAVIGRAKALSEQGYQDRAPECLIAAWEQARKGVNGDSNASQLLQSLGEVLAK